MTFVCADDINFKSLWRRLAKKGWKARKPTGLATQLTYVLPVRDPRGNEGEGYLVGERPVTEMYLRPFRPASTSGK
ncbi:TPA: hypothetical protein N0F65_004562 [Lagenidium giganteum]|uniref:Uncharacterized protein n=1 Tax=Lagenidium giganteum TaxID=4803 RepID=A0AAV2ZEF2_9STRA|nr:TPA: hypothetical protein N0F65_004562 [Lagenidium giganteum]